VLIPIHLFHHIILNHFSRKPYLNQHSLSVTIHQQTKRTSYYHRESDSLIHQERSKYQNQINFWVHKNTFFETIKREESIKKKQTIQEVPEESSSTTTTTTITNNNSNNSNNNNKEDLVEPSPLIVSCIESDRVNTNLINSTLSPTSSSSPSSSSSPILSSVETKEISSSSASSTAVIDKAVSPVINVDKAIPILPNNNNPIIASFTTSNTNNNNSNNNIMNHSSGSAIEDDTIHSSMSEETDEDEQHEERFLRGLGWVPAEEDTVSDTEIEEICLKMKKMSNQ